MTSQADVANDVRYVPYLDHGFIGLVEHMGSDETIEESARMSYGKGTRSIADTRQLLRYLLRHYHTSPFEMGVVRFHLKLPIFVMRQLVRHRTAGLNEYSGRYSEMVDEFYLPPNSRIQLQSLTNKQGSGAQMEEPGALVAMMEKVHNFAYDTYRGFLAAGMARELARIILPVSNYTELYWKIDLNNFFKTMRLRMDSHSQKEIVELATPMYEFVKPLFPISCEAFEDYHLHGVAMSRMEMELIRSLLRSLEEPALKSFAAQIKGSDALGKREKDEFFTKLRLT